MSNPELVPITKSALAGERLEVPPFVWPKEMVKSGVTQHKSRRVFAGQLTAAVYETADIVLDIKGQAYDEIIHVLQGVATLTPQNGEPQHFHAGDMCVIPKGFTGTWEMRDNFRKLSVVETAAFADGMARMLQAKK
jgi:uncharacterized cupin superfamily protein